ncbi:MAG: glycosyl transferase family 1 [Candidatus Aminicenantes bacterium RBG_16_63_16]|nr:MAG: glycosyl transferase family 1 [Candidatus Aminicenantes bacterium RBG_16_63_16]
MNSKIPNTSFTRAGFISTRLAGTDGVTLEVKKWAHVLERNGLDCFYFGGKLDCPEGRSFLVPEAYFEHPDIKDINAGVFGVRRRRPEISAKIHAIKEALKAALYEFQREFSPDLIIPENALAIPMNIPLGMAITEFIAETGIPTIAHHHDFSWERDRFLINACRDYLDMSFPPSLPSIAHVVINSLASEQLSHRRGLSSTVIPNVLDFAAGAPPVDMHCLDLRKKLGLKKGDLFILQPTRVVSRKRIERSVELVKELDLRRPRLIISHGAEDEGTDYYHRLLEYARRMGVEIVPIDSWIAPERTADACGLKQYAIADLYRCSDLVTYPSGYEGFGNAFLEALFFRRPVVVNRYSTYVADIEPKGFQVIVIDAIVTSRVIEQIREVLTDPGKLDDMVETNYRLARKYFSYEVLEEKLLHLVRTFSA